MHKLVLALLLFAGLAHAGPAPVMFTYGGSCSTIITVPTVGTPVATNASLTASITITVAHAGDTIFLLVSHEAGDGSNPTVSVSDGTAYSQDVEVARGNQSLTGLYSLWNATSGSHTITATASTGIAADSYFYINAIEVKGLGTTNSLDQAVSNSANTSTTPTSGTTNSLAQANEFVITALTANAIATGWTIPPTGGNNSPFVSIYSSLSPTSSGMSADADYQINTTSTTAVQSAWGTMNTARLWAALVGTYKGTCSSLLPPPPSAGQIKWHPGHYALPDPQPAGPAYTSDIQGDMLQMAQANNPATGKPGFLGFLDNFAWNALDMGPSGSKTGGGSGGPVDGQTGGGTLPAGWSGPLPQYNTSLIDADLAYLATLTSTYGPTLPFKLIIQVTYESPGTCPSSVPSTPQATPYSSSWNSQNCNILPDYIINGINGLGSDAFLQVFGLGIAATMWRPADTAAYNNLLTYLGQKYDSNSNVEMISPIYESASSPSSNPSDFTDIKWVTAQKSIIANTKGAFPTTNIVYATNFNPTGVTLADLISVMTYAQSIGVGFSGPDMAQPADGSCSGTCAPGSGDGPSYGMAVFIGYGSPYGTTNYRGTVPTGWREQADAYVHPNECASGLEAYQYTTLNATHEIWGNHDGNGTACQQWNGVVSALQGVDFRIFSTACPTLYSTGCKTN